MIKNIPNLIGPIVRGSLNDAGSLLNVSTVSLQSDFNIGSGAINVLGYTGRPDALRLITGNHNDNIRLISTFEDGTSTVLGSSIFENKEVTVVGLGSEDSFSTFVNFEGFNTTYANLIYTVEGAPTGSFEIRMETTSGSYLWTSGSAEEGATRYIINSPISEVGSTNLGSITNIRILTESGGTGSYLFDYGTIGSEDYQNSTIGDNNENLSISNDCQLILNTEDTSADRFSLIIPDTGSVSYIGSPDMLLKTTLEINDDSGSILYNNADTGSNYMLTLGSTVTSYITDSGSMTVLGSATNISTGSFYNILINKGADAHDIFIQSSNDLGSGWHIDANIGSNTNGSEVQITNPSSHMQMRDLYIFNADPIGIHLVKGTNPNDIPTLVSNFNYFGAETPGKDYTLTTRYEVFLSGTTNAGPIFAQSGSIAYGLINQYAGSSLLVEHNISAGSYVAIGSAPIIGGEQTITITKTNNVFNIYVGSAIEDNKYFSSENIFTTGSFGYYNGDASTIFKYQQYIDSNQIGSQTNIEEISDELYLLVNGYGGAEIDSFRINYTLG